MRKFILVKADTDTGQLIAYAGLDYIGNGQQYPVWQNLDLLSIVDPIMFSSMSEAAKAAEKLVDKGYRVFLHEVNF